MAGSQKLKLNKLVMYYSKHICFADCYRRYKEDTAFRSRALVETIYARDEEECARECDFYRDRGQYQCNAFSFRSDRRWVIIIFASTTCICPGSRVPIVSSVSPMAETLMLIWSLPETGRSGSWGALGDHAELTIMVKQKRFDGISCIESTGTSLAGEYTVNGQRCLRGGCRLNQDVKYW